MAKKKGSNGGNPNPVQNEEFLAKQFKPFTDVEGVTLAKSSIGIKLPVAVDAIVRSLPDRSTWVRAAIMAKLEADGLLPIDQ